MKRALFLLALAASIVACAPPPPPMTIDVALRGASYRLPNGLEVVLHPDRALVNVAVDVRYHVGSKDDPPLRSGFAHLFEHLMFLGSRNVSEDRFATLLNDAGAIDYNAHTTCDATEYHEVVPPSQVPLALWLEADRMAHPVDRVTAENLARERDVVKNEWSERYDNVPYGHLRSIVRAAVFPDGHPYHLPTIGRVVDLDRATLDDVKAFAARWYQPANATLVVAGDINVAQTRALVDRLFGSIPPGPPLPMPRAFGFPKLEADVRVFVEADVEAPRVVIAWPAPPPFTPGYDETQIAMAEIRSWVAYKLQVQSKVARRVRWEMDPGRLGSLLSLVVDLEPGESPGNVVSVVETRVAWIAEFDPDRWQDFADARTGHMAALLFDLRHATSRAERMQDYLEFLGAADSAQADLRHIQAIRAGEASRAADTLLAESGKLVVVVRPTPGAPRAGRVVP